MAPLVGVRSLEVVMEASLGVIGLALAAAAAVSLTALRFGALSASGAVAGTIVGAVVLVFAGLAAAIVLVAFFVTSSGLSRLGGRAGRSRRDAWQVMANGSVAAAAALFHSQTPLAAVAILGAVAAATADTWATELGVRFGRRPRSILTLRPQPAGTSGAVSVTGTAAAAAGGVAVAALGVALGLAGWGTAVAVAVAGLAGAMVDSLLGAAAQAKYLCRACGARPEVARHAGCSRRAERVAGVPGIDNDAVNFLATAVGAATAVALYASL